MPSIQADAHFAEILASPGYRRALNAAFDSSGEAVGEHPAAYELQREQAQAIILGALSLGGSNLEGFIWEIRRHAAIAQLGGHDLGTFGTYFALMGGETKPADPDIESLGPGDIEAVRTNRTILHLNTAHASPFDFMDAALGIIKSRKSESRSKVGPENYCTTLKFFADKYQELESPDRRDQQVVYDVKELVDQCMDGFVEAAERDSPNLVEMTNIYLAVCKLPPGSFDERYTKPIIAHSIDQLPNYHGDVLRHLIAAMGKLDLEDDGVSAAALFDLTLRKSPPFERSSDLRNAMRVMAALPDHPTSNSAFAALLNRRNDLEQAMDIDDLELMVRRLRGIVNRVVTDQTLSLRAKGVAELCVKRAYDLVTGQMQRPSLAKMKPEWLLFWIVLAGTLKLSSLVCEPASARLLGRD